MLNSNDLESLSQNALEFLKYLAELYKETGVNSFNAEQYMCFSHYPSALEELMDAGYLLWKDGRKNILATVVINFDAFEEED